MDGCRQSFAADCRLGPKQSDLDERLIPQSVTEGLCLLACLCQPPTAANVLSVHWMDVRALLSSTDSPRVMVHAIHSERKRLLEQTKR
jgi:hypothetical protein